VDIFLEKLNSKSPSGIHFTKKPNKIDTKRTYKVEKIFEWEH
jgi:hypothetical protein